MFNEMFVCQVFFFAPIPITNINIRIWKFFVYFDHYKIEYNNNKNKQLFFWYRFSIHELSTKMGCDGDIGWRRFCQNKKTRKMNRNFMLTDRKSKWNFCTTKITTTKTWYTQRENLRWKKIKWIYSWTTAWLPHQTIGW